MDPYINYVRALATRGYTRQAIKNDLLARGMDTQTVEWLIQVLASTPGITIVPGTPAAPMPSFTDTLPQPTQPAAQSGEPGQPASATESAQQRPAVPEQTQTPSQPSPAAPTQTSLADRATTPSPSAIVDSERPGFFSIAKGYIITLLLCLVPTLILLFDAPWSTRFGSGSATLLTIGDISGVIGLVLYAVDLVLSTRLSWLEDWFGGLKRVYGAHALLGGLALIFILIHPILISLRYVPAGWHTVGGFFVPSTAHLATASGIIALDLTLILLIITLYAHLPYRLWLWTHKLLGLAYFFIALHVLYSPNAITFNLVERWYLILVTLAGAAAFVYRTLLPDVLVKHYTYVIKSVEQKATGVQEITMTPTSQAMPFKPGQFIFIAFDTDGLSPEWHPFSIVSPPGDGTLTVAVKSLGAYTETVTRLIPNMVGMSLRVEGAYGRFSFRNFRNANQIWVAGGIGITPFLSMAQALGDSPYNIDLYYSVRSEAELIDIDVLARHQSSQPGHTFRVIPFVTEKYSRHISADMITATSGDLSGRDFLLCGPIPMMDELKKQLLTAGVKKYRIHTEDFSIS